MVNNSSFGNSRRINEIYNSVAASFVDIEKNMDNLMHGNQDLNELFDDIKIISKNNFTVDGLEGLKNILNNSGID